MKALHIWDVAGVGSVIAKRTGTESWVIMRKRFDKFGLTTYGECWDCGGKIFTLKALWMARRYDLFHVHYFDRIVPLLKMFFPRKPVVLHYHGSDIRGRWRERRKYWSEADLVIVSTPDLLDGAPEGVVYLPNPVDTELFKPLKDHFDNSAIYIVKHQEELGEKLEWPKAMARKYGLKLSFRDRVEDPIPHVDLPMFLNQYSYLIDRDYVKSLSKTALEALACGLRVITWNDEIVGEFPQEHNPIKVVQKLSDLYETL